MKAGRVPQLHGAVTVPGGQPAWARTKGHRAHAA